MVNVLCPNPNEGEPSAGSDDSEMESKFSESSEDDMELDGLEPYDDMFLVQYQRNVKIEALTQRDSSKS